MASEEKGRDHIAAADAAGAPLQQRYFIESHSRRQDEVKYTFYVRLPFKRGDFVDPPPADWDESKSEKLWGIISGVAKAEIDWNQLATRFGVTVPYILQMAAYLTERHFSELRAQMAKVSQPLTKGSNTSSPVPGSEPTILGAGSIGSAAGLPAGGRAPSALSICRDSPLPRNDGSIPGTPVKSSLRPQVSRNLSGNATVMTQQNLKAIRLGDNQRRRLSSLPITSAPATPSVVAGPSGEQPQEEHPPSPGPAESSSAASSSSSSSSSDAVQSRIIRRPPRFQPQDVHRSFSADGYNDDDAEDEEPEPAFLAYKPQSTAGSSQKSQDLGATLRGAPGSAFAHRLHPSHPDKGKVKELSTLQSQSQTSDSSNSEAAAMSQRGFGGDAKRPGPLSPRRTAELVGRSPGGRGKGYSREGSDGAPSMGSSFSDLDDASVTQSALEEALASRMQDGTLGSRMSSFGQMFRSRQFPNKPGRS